MSFNTIIFEEDGPVGTLMLNRPDDGNMFNTEMCHEVRDCIERVRREIRTRVLVLTGSGEKVFCIGGRKDDLQNTHLYAGVLPTLEMYEAIDRLQKPVIASVNGFAVGGGNVLQVVWDLSIAKESAIFRQMDPMMGSFAAGYGICGTSRRQEKGEGTLVLQSKDKRGTSVGNGSNQPCGSRRGAREQDTRGRPSKTREDPKLLGALEALVEPCTRGDSDSVLRWTHKSLRVLANDVCTHQTGRIIDKLVRPKYNDALRFLDEGLASASDIDLTCRLGLGYADGPVERVERGGLAHHHDVSKALFEAYGQPEYMPGRRATVAKIRAQRDEDAQT